MTLNDSQRAALKLIRDAKTPIGHKTAENPGHPHHKTLEGLAARLLIEKTGAGFSITEAGRTVLATK